ncbi:hypothetical protein DRN34_01035 [Thermococci archaeon]|nr:MAG: hypothetical protein DRN34_01035 [Thermococci archaeon]
MNEAFYDAIRKLVAKYSMKKAYLLQYKRYRKARKLSEYFNENIEILKNIYEKEGFSQDFLILAHEIENKIDNH